ncbi:MAG: Peptidoglycan-binding protein LysM [uncultured Thiotrichaceae bacterium]|uniref:Peptidoglycan-binding protein LysM n=1 Tax=uncultured Thiotrichaceae bacterium TaxID=298394 RepID=A0A6S6U5V1_9GAMM|nr:MAG: Peptidoglycan-binding protein LysM [uncultured Thiotrichaceae bacterium]
MGLFDFAHNIGKKLFDKEEEAGEKIQEHIAEDNPGVSNLNVSVEDGVATITGEAESASALEKAILMTGNAMGISEVRAEGLTAPTSDVDVQYYEIEKGDSLWKIADKLYGDGNKYKQIFEENKEVIKDPDLIFAGQKIRIPSA